MLLHEPKVHAIGAQSALSPALGRGTEKEWPREMRKQIEFSKTIARPGYRRRCGVVVLVIPAAEAKVEVETAVVRGTCRYEGDLPLADRSCGRAMARIREKDKGRRGWEIRAPTELGERHEEEHK